MTDKDIKGHGCAPTCEIVVGVGLICMSYMRIEIAAFMSLLKLVTKDVPQSAHLTSRKVGGVDKLFGQNPFLSFPNR